ncbi:MAG: polyprenyl synthetase family protein [Acidimicrobiales bacterium]
MIPIRSVPGVLARVRDLSSPAIEAALARLSPEVRPLAEYHFGLADEQGLRTEARSTGKGVRPALAVLSAEAAGAPAEVGVPGAVGVELVHNFSLIHDDVIDCDRERRHRPTVWSIWGVGRAIIAGDALLALSQQVLLEAASGKGQSTTSAVAAAAAARCLAEATGDMISGQALDMAFESLPGIDVDRCLSMEARKTGALLGCASSLGAILAGAPESTTSALRDFGVQLGLAFQAVDDVLGIWGDPTHTGKPSGNDIRQHKKTLPIAAALAAGGPMAYELAILLEVEELDEEQIARAAYLVESCGGRALADDEAAGRLAAALDALERAALDERAREELCEVARFVVARDF